MKKDIYYYLHFRLESQYEEYEFDLIPIPPYDFIENNLSLEPFEYFGEKNFIFGIKAKTIILYYNADILVKVKIKFKADNVEALISRIEDLNLGLPVNVHLTLFFSTKEDMTILTYQKKFTEEEHTST